MNETDQDKDVQDLIDQRARVREWWENDKAPKPENMVGLALSGGGIRSATFSLGVIQSLARSSRDALATIDIVSSVSGGGYIACFLRSLFMPDEGRGIVPKANKRKKGKLRVELTSSAVVDQYRFARHVLSSTADEKDVRWPPRPPDEEDIQPDDKAVLRRNPLWWLREHSRYLAPNGPTDYGYAAAYIARNWVAMIYIFLIASIASLSVVIGFEVAIRMWAPHAFDWTWIAISKAAAKCSRCTSTISLVPLSPVTSIALVPVLISMMLAIGYWMTQAMSPNESNAGRQWKNLAIATAGTILSGILIIVAASYVAPGALNPTVLAETIVPGSVFVWILTAGLVLTMLGTSTALICAIFIAERPGSLTANLRSVLTNALARWNRRALIVLCVALVDTIGAGLSGWMSQMSLRQGSLSAALLPAIAYLIKKIPDWFGGPGKSTIFGLLQRSMSTVALIAGILLFGIVAVAAAALVHANAWMGLAWTSQPDWPRFLLFVFVVVVMALLSGTASGFINLSSLHSFYASRLTRAYLGASNNERLEAAARPTIGSNITETDPNDYIQPQVYCSADLPAPIHVINATINETIDPHSQLVARDRKGDIFSISPAGIRVGNEPVPWARVGKKEAEQLSLGQWCAISGAAASSGMGRMTSLGFALAFTFANVRLGYWWWSPKVCTDCAPPLSVSKRISMRCVGTFVYLANEMTARYSRGYERKYLTDGGHFENSGAYRLIQHKVPLILVCDNGADEHYRFSDLENLVRTVRLDFGVNFELLGGTDLDAFLKKWGGSDSTAFVDPAKHPDWRAQFADPSAKGFVLVLRAIFESEPVHLIWLKPRTLSDLPPDLLGYAGANSTFPQQSTGDQFFDEAQWESYRKLGEILIRRLLDECPTLLKRIRLAEERQ